MATNLAYKAAVPIHLFSSISWLLLPTVMIGGYSLLSLLAIMLAPDLIFC